MVYILSDVLRLTAQSKNVGSSDPCWIRQGADDSDVEMLLTYRAAVTSAHQHVGALRQALSQIPGRRITMAYLDGSNSVDLALSIVAASNLAVTRTTAFFPRTIRPALLNTRWSVTEMAAALQPALSNVESSSILLIHGQAWHETAERLRDVLVRDSDSSTVVVMALPTFGLHNFVSASKAAPQNSSRDVHNQRPGSKTQSTWYHDIATLARDASSDDAVLVFTSGTTSTAKGVRLSHRALLVQAAAKVAPPCGYSPHTRMLATTVPFFHVGGLSSLLAVWMAGGALVEPSMTVRDGGAGFSPVSVMYSLSHPVIPCNTLVVVPAMVHALHQQQQQSPSVAPMSHVDLILVGGQSLSRGQHTFLRKAFPAARIVQTFACTEAASSLTFRNVTQTMESPTTGRQHSPKPPPGVCVGTPPAHVQIQLADTEFTSSRDVTSFMQSPFQVGLIATRGPHVMSGYWGKPPHDGSKDWYLTSDLGYWDESGQLYFCGRQTDTIRTGGETVWATEVEAILQQHENVDEVAVIGLPDDRWGETVACVIVIKHKNDAINLKELRDWCKRMGLASYKHPRRMVVLSLLPRSSSGKILKRQLRTCFESAPTSRI